MLKPLLYVAKRLAVAGFFTLAELGLAGLFGAPQAATLHARLTAYALTFAFLLTVPDPDCSKAGEEEYDGGSHQERGQTHAADHEHHIPVHGQKPVPDALKHRV